MVLFLDCGNIDRMPVDFLRDGGAHVVNIDHHHDNTRFGDVNLVDTGASCTAEIVYELARHLGVELTPEIASALYVGLVTDTGRFMYENTDARPHRIAAELIEAGVDVDDTYRRLYESVPIEKLKLLARALEAIELPCDGRSRSPTSHRGRLRGDRCRRGDDRGDHRLPALARRDPRRRRVRDQAAVGGRRARSACARAATASTSRQIARRHGGGGHVRAAGFSTDLG